MNRNSEHRGPATIVEAATTRRKTWFLPDGFYCFEDKITSAGLFTTRILTGAAWLLELYQLKAGELCFFRGTERVYPRSSTRFGALFPPCTISRPSFTRACGRVFGLAGTAQLPSKFAHDPMIFDTTYTDLTSGAELPDMLHSAMNAQSIHTNPAASALSLRAKRLIDQSYLTGIRVSVVAARLLVTPEHLARQFRRDFAMSPTEYLHQLRIADAPFKLAAGEQIASISTAVGYNDLSRFYKQFRKATSTSPGACKAVVAPGARRRLV